MKKKLLFMILAIVSVVGIIMSGIFHLFGDWNAQVFAITAVGMFTSGSLWDRSWKDNIPNYREWYWQTRTIYRKILDVLAIYFSYLFIGNVNMMNTEWEMTGIEIILSGFPLFAFAIGIHLQSIFIYKKLIKLNWFAVPGNVYNLIKLKKDRDKSGFKEWHWYNNTEHYPDADKKLYTPIDEGESEKMYYTEIDDNVRESGKENVWIKKEDCDIIKKIKK